MTRYCCLILMILVAFCVPAFANQLVNGDFETGALSPWFATNLTAVDYSMSTSNPHSGTYCAVGVAGTEPEGAIGGLAQESFPLQPNKTYLISCWYRTEGTEWAYSWDASFAEIDIYQKDAAGSVVAGSAVIVIYTPTANWARASLAINTTSSTVSGYLVTNCHLAVSSPGNKLFLDDFNVSEVDNTQKPFNGGFETGWIDGWAIAGTGNQFDVTATNPHSGGYSARCSVGATPDSADTIYQDMTIEPNKYYVASFYYRTEGANWTGEEDAQSRFGSAVDLYTPTGFPIEREVIANNPEPSATWTRASFAFVSDVDAGLARWWTQCYITGSEDHVYFDDFKIAPVQYADYENVGRVKKDGAWTFANVDGILTGATSESLFFVESVDRSAGMLVESSAFPLSAMPAEGDTVRLKGKLAPALDTANFGGMLSFQPDETPVVVPAPHASPLGPIGANNRAAATALHECVFAKVWGRVSGSDPGISTFNIDDGSGIVYRVGYYYGWPFPNDGDYVSVTGMPVSLNGIGWLYCTNTTVVDILEVAPQNR